VPARRIPPDILGLTTDGGRLKYNQVVDRVVAELRAGRLRKGDRLPSINEACAHTTLSRDTVVKAYSRLKEMRLLSAIHGKGFFLRTDSVDVQIKAFVLFDSWNAYKEKVYAGLAQTVGHRAELDVYFHHCNPGLFRRLLKDARGAYEHYVVMPFADPTIGDALAALEQDKLLLLDIAANFTGKRCASITQDFDTQLVAALSTGTDRLRRYQSFTLVHNPVNRHPIEVQGAFTRFALMHRIRHDIVATLPEAGVRPGGAYLVIEDDDLVNLVKYCKHTGHQLGGDVGVVSYNDTPLKEVVAGGISVVSIDFFDLGVQAGKQVLEPKEVHITEPTRLILRSSL
jgi:DNA-binding transcriptional regulator YhcF (GntR family)